VILPDGPREQGLPATVWHGAGEGLSQALGGGPDEDPAVVSARLTAHHRTDVVVLRRTGPGTLVAELLDVAVPSGWDPRERAGASLTQLHDPVGDNSRLQAAAPAIAEMILTRGPYEMFVWGLQADGRLARWPGEQLWPADPRHWWLRVERQVTVPLAHLQRALFWLRPSVNRVDSLPPEQQQRLLAAVSSMSQAHLDYKGLPADAARLLAAALR
jgi:hypothetical protein